MSKRSLPNPKKIAELEQIIEAALRGKPAGKKTGEHGPLDQIAQSLRHMPRQGLQARLRKELERSIAMATASKLPTTQSTFASPRLSYKNAGKAITFYEKAFGAKESWRFENELGMGHAEILIGDSIVMLCDEWPEGGRYSAETLGQSPVSMSVQVPDVDAFVAHAVASGATLKTPATDQFYGYRDAVLLDPFGYAWTIYTVKEVMPVEEMHRRFRASMPPAKKSDVTPVPKGYRTLTQYLVAADADGQIEFLKKTFDAEEVFRSGPGSQGGLHCEMRLGDSMIMVGGGGPGLAWKGEAKPGAFHVYVRDCDATYQRALAAGGVSVNEPADQFYGERSSTVRDAAGNFWYIATYKGESYKWAGAPDVQPSLHPLRAEPVMTFLKKAFGAEELSRHATPEGVILHATMKLGDSQLELGEAHGPYQPMRSMFYLYVPDCDALYRRALAAGATSVMEPTDHPYGDRSGAVKDAFGYEWWIATHIKDMPA